MKRSELQVGMEYAIGSRSESSTPKRAVFIGADEQIVIRSGWQGTEQRPTHGPVFELHAEEKPWGWPPSPLKEDVSDKRRILVPHGGSVLRTWAEQVERDAAKQQRKAAHKAEQEAVRELTRANLKALRERFGFDVAARGQTGAGGVQLSYGHGEVTLSARALAELIELISGPALAPGAVPAGMAGPGSRALAFVEQAKRVDLGEFEEHELERLKSLASTARQDAADACQRFERALWAKQHPGEAF